MKAAESNKSGHAATGTVGKALSLLDIVADAEEPMRFTEILRQSGQPRGTLHRQLTHLVGEGLLSVNRDHTYSLGLRLLRLASRSWGNNQFRTITEPHLKALLQLTNETIHLGVLSGAEVIYLDKVESRKAVRMYSQIGNSSPAYCTGVGKAALSLLDDDEIEPLIRQFSFFAYTEHTLTSGDALKAEIESIRKAGVAFDREEHEIGIRCVAAPIGMIGPGNAAAISVTGPAYRVSDAQLLEWVDPVKRIAKAILADMEIRLSPRG